MDEDKIIGRIAFIVSLLAFFGVLCVGCYAYFDKPVDVDINGINENALLITSLQNDVSGVKGDINLLLDMYQDKVTEDDLEDLEDDLEKYCRNRCEDGEKGDTGIQGPIGPEGPQGIPGINGTSCTVEYNETSGCAVISCTDGSNVTICDGVDGEQGIPGIDGEDGQDGSDGADGIDGKDGFLSEEEYDCLVNATNYKEFTGCLANITA